MPSRREFLGKTAVVAAAVASAGADTLPSGVVSGIGASTQIVSLCGKWSFQVDAANAGIDLSWFGASHLAAGWQKVEVPHTWQVEPSRADYRGIAWYRREFDVPSAWREGAVRIEFEAVFHSTTV